jgi:hypothetical protein
VDRAALQTFATKTDADVWLTMKDAEIHRGDWIDPDAGKILFGTCSWPRSPTCASVNWRRFAAVNSTWTPARFA